ncbi:MAG: sulfur carrier protein ThiS [Candidatus Omnitrophica bacterium]|nr:sulfur carrier protein ThiS [Candidatus Omnitrophota bacterium]
MKIAVNGEHRDIPEGMSVRQLLEMLGVNPLLVAVELNVDILSRGQYASARLKEGDQVEIVHMVGGGA